MATANWHDDRAAESRVPLQIGSLYTTDGASTSSVEIEIERGPESRPEPPDQVDLAGQHGILLPCHSEEIIVVTDDPCGQLELEQPGGSMGIMYPSSPLMAHRLAPMLISFSGS